MLLIWGTAALSRVISHIIQSVNSTQKNIFKELYNHVCDDMLSRKIRVKCSSCLQELDSLGLLTGFFCLMFGGSIFSHLADNHNHHLVTKLMTTFHVFFTKQERSFLYHWSPSSEGEMELDLTELGHWRFLCYQCSCIQYFCFFASLNN